MDDYPLFNDAARLGGVGILTPDDLARLRAGVKRVYLLMQDGAWHTGPEICAAARGSEGLRRLRELRVHYEIEKRRQWNLWEYRINV